MLIPLPENYNTDWMLEHLRTSSFGAPYRFLTDRLARRALRIEDGTVLVELDFSKVASLSVRTLDSTGRPGDEQQAIRLAIFLMGLDDALCPGGRLLEDMRNDDILGPIVEQFGVLSIVRSASLYESLVVGILGQQVSVGAAQSIRRRLMHEFGTKVYAKDEEDPYYIYPDPQRMTEIGLEELRGIGASRQKATYLNEVARFALMGELDPHHYHGITDEECIKRLCAIKGVGRWTAEVGVMRGLGRPDILPAGDLGLQVSLERILGLPKRPTEREFREIGERWKGYRSHAAFYLWAALSGRAL